MTIINSQRLSMHLIRHDASILDLKTNHKARNDLMNKITHTNNLKNFKSLCSALVVGLRDRYSNDGSNLKNIKFFNHLDNAGAIEINVDDVHYALQTLVNPTCTTENAKCLIALCTHRHATFSRVCSYPRTLNDLFKVLGISTDTDEMMQIKFDLDNQIKNKIFDKLKMPLPILPTRILPKTKIEKLQMLNHIDKTGKMPIIKNIIKKEKHVKFEDDMILEIGKNFENNFIHNVDYNNSYSTRSSSPKSFKAVNNVIIKTPINKVQIIDKALNDNLIDENIVDKIQNETSSLNILQSQQHVEKDINPLLEADELRDNLQNKINDDIIVENITEQYQKDNSNNDINLGFPVIPCADNAEKSAWDIKNNVQPKEESILNETPKKIELALHEINQQINNIDEASNLEQGIEYVINLNKSEPILEEKASAINADYLQSKKEMIKTCQNVIQEIKEDETILSQQVNVDEISHFEREMTASQFNKNSEKFISDELEDNNIIKNIYLGGDVYGKNFSNMAFPENYQHQWKTEEISNFIKEIIINNNSYVTTYNVLHAIQSINDDEQKKRFWLNFKDAIHKYAITHNFQKYFISQPKSSYSLLDLYEAFIFNNVIIKITSEKLDFNKTHLSNKCVLSYDLAIIERIFLTIIKYEIPSLFGFIKKNIMQEYVMDELMTFQSINFEIQKNSIQKNIQHLISYMRRSLLERPDEHNENEILFAPREYERYTKGIMYPEKILTKNHILDSWNSFIINLINKSNEKYVSDSIEMTQLRVALLKYKFQSFEDLLHKPLI